MKKIVMILAATTVALALWGQGTLQLAPGAHVKITGGAYLVLNDMHLVNDGNFQQAAGSSFVRLTGSMNTNLSGSSTSTFDELLLEKLGPAVVSLNQDKIVVVSKLLFDGGNLNLNNNVVDLLNSGIFSNESEFSRAFTTGTGYIKRTEILNAPSAKNPGNLGAIITSPENLGLTTIRRGHQVQTVPGGSIRRFYDIEPTKNVTLKATLRFHYFDAELNGLPEATLYQWKSKNMVLWEVAGADNRDISANYVERGNHSKFDRMTLATATAPSITCPVNMTESANQKGCKASVSFAATATGIPAPTITYRIGTTVITSPHVFSKGTTTVTATASNGVEPDATCSFTVTVVCGPMTTTELVTDTREVIATPLVMTVRPNPSASYFTLNLSSGGQEPVSLQVVDVMGRVVEVHSNVAPNGTSVIGHNYRPGVYFVQAVQGSRIVMLRIIKAGE